MWGTLWGTIFIKMAIKKITINGQQFRSINAACKFNKVKKSTYIGRRHRGWSIIKSITTKTIKKKDQKPAFVKKIRFVGKTFPSLKALCKFKGVPYHTFHARQKKGMSLKDSLNNNRSGLSGPSPKTIKQRALECKENLKKFAYKENLNKIDDWYKIKLKQLDKITSVLRKFKKLSTVEILETIYPKGKFLPWKFVKKGGRIIKGTWEKKENRIKYIKWLKKELNYKTLSNFYKINYQIFKDNYGEGLTHSSNSKTKERFTILYLLKEAYPNYHWKFWLFAEAPNDVWNDKNNHKIFFDWVLKKEKINIFKKNIYTFTAAKFKKYKGASTLLNKYDNFFDCLEKLYPEANLNRFNFKRQGRGFWSDKSNHKAALLFIGNRLGFKNKNDWYNLKYEDFENVGFFSLIEQYDSSPAKIATKLLPEFKFDKTKFDFSSKDEFRARCYAKCLFKNIQSNAHPTFLKRKETGKTLELDIFIPKLKLAIEYNGKQHYFDVYNNRKDFLKLKERDKIKKDRCKKNDIKLIIIKYNEWDGFPQTFIDVIKKNVIISKKQIESFWKDFKKDDLYPEIMLEIKKKIK